MREESEEVAVSYAEKWMEAYCQANATGGAPSSALSTDEPKTYAMLIQKIKPWRISNSMKRKLEETQCLGERQIACSISISFYNAGSKKFYGATFVGCEHMFVLKKSLNEINSLDINLNELVYFHTKVVDPNSIIVCELVASLFGQFGEGEKKYGCGYAVVSPFSEILLDEDERSHSNPVKSGSICIYDGSPRDLLDAKEPGGILQQLRKQETKCMMSYKIWRCSEIGTALNSVRLIREDQIVGSHTKIAGLAQTTIDCFDERGSSKLPCIGAKTRGCILDWTLVPSQSIHFAPTLQLNIDNLLVSIPNRCGFEEACCQWVTNTHPRNQDGVLGRVSGLLRNCSSPIKGNRIPITVVSRRVRVGAHNGHSFMHWHVIELQQDENLDALKMNSSLNIPAINDEDFAIVFVLEYTCEENAIKSPTKLPPRSFNVTVGTSVLSPFNNESKRIGSGVRLNLINDFRYSVFTSNITFLPSNAPSCVMSFDINTEENNQTGEKQNILPPQLSMHLDTKGQGGQEAKVVRPLRDEAKEDFDSIHHDTSTLTFDETLVEEKDDSDEGLPVPRPTAPASGICYQHDYSILTEVDDENNATEVTIRLALFSLSDIGMKMFHEAPRSLSFHFKLREHDEVLSGHLVLQNSMFMDPSLISFEYQYNSPEHAKMLATYMLKRPLFIDVFDDGNFHLGTVALPLHLLVRQGKTNRSMENIAVDVISSGDDGCRDSVLRIKEGMVACGIIVGSVTLSIDLKGKQMRVATVATESIEPSGAKRHALNLLDTNVDLRTLIAKVSGTSADHESSGNCKNVDGDGTFDHFSQLSVRHRQLAAVDAYNRRYQGRTDRVDLLLSVAKEITPYGPNHDEEVLVCAAKIVRERMKKDVIAVHIADENKPKVISASPFVGQSLLIEVEVTNPLAVDECFVIQSSHQSVRLVTSATEWDRRRRTFGAIICAESLVSFDSLQEDRITMKAHQTQVLPILLDQRTTAENAKIIVSLLSSKTQAAVHSFEIEVSPLLQVDRRFVIPCRENENIKRRFEFEAQDANKALTVKVIDETARGVKFEWNQCSSGSNDALYHLTVEVTCVEKSKNVMYVVISNDDFASIVESWKIVFEARTPLYDTACLGARMQKEILIKGGKDDRVLKCRAMILPNHLESGGSLSICQFEKSSFQLLANQVNRVHVEFQFQAAGSWNVLLNCIDQFDKEIVNSFILTVQCFLPAISKVSKNMQPVSSNQTSHTMNQEYSIVALPGKSKQIKLPFTNCLAQTRIVEIASSNDLILLPQTPKLQLGKGETVYARFRVKVEESLLTKKDVADEIDVFLFTRDLTTKTEDCVRIRIKIPDL